ncbi:uncharacterized protein LOC143178892 [Calliopsis andreniformis]|uniref:uncharacterized protein LOC143178892 n=1 Tax=Calliopsis andreniformis TaxID=337506 RepID=UPI003FCC771E
MEDQELINLQNLKAELLEKAYTLIGQLKEQEKNKESVTFDISNITKSVSNTEKNMSEETEMLLCKVASQVTGITFTDIDKKWLKDDLYCYTTKLVTKSISILIKLIVDIKEDVEFEIQDITCHFISIDPCYMLEIEPWTLKITKMKNFSLLVSEISQYNQQYQLRKKIVHSLEVQKYGTARKYTKEKGGFLIDIHSPENVQNVYLELQWSLCFMDRTWRIEHFFNIVASEKGIEFVKENQDTLQNFCKRNISKIELINLWQQLCIAIDKYEGRDANSSTSNSTA